MRRLVLLGALLAVVVLASAQTVSDDLDRITGTRTIRYTADGSTDLTKPVVTFLAAYEGESSLSTISLAFVSQDQGGGVPPPRFAGCHVIEWFADGQPLAIAPATYRGRVVDGEMIELIDQAVQTSWVLAVAAAGTVRYRVCRSEYTLTSSDVKAFGTIAAKLKGTNYLRPSGALSGASPEVPHVVEYKGMNWRPRNPDTMFPKRR